MNILGKSTINPIFYWTGKSAGYVVLVFLFIEIGKIEQFSWLTSLIVLFAFIGLLLLIFSLFNLGSSARFGIPKEGTKLKTGGLYRFSRNPLYLGFDMMTISAILLTLNLWIALLGIYSIIIYHFIILGEEKFLIERFGEEYTTFMDDVRRYL